MAKNIDIAGRLHSVATGNVVAGANEIYDDDEGLKQSEVNAALRTAQEALAQDIEEELDKKQDAISEVTVSVDDSIGKPEVTHTFIDGNLGIDFKNLKGERGNGIDSISEVLSPLSGGVNTHIITDDDGREHVFHTINGERGAQGDSVFVGQGDLPLAHVLGQDNTKAISQKGVTDAVAGGMIVTIPEESRRVDSYHEGDDYTWRVEANTGMIVSVNTPHAAIEVELTPDMTSITYNATQYTGNYGYAFVDAEGGYITGSATQEAIPNLEVDVVGPMKAGAVKFRCCRNTYDHYIDIVIKKNAVYTWPKRYSEAVPKDDGFVTSAGIIKAVSDVAEKIVGNDVINMAKVTAMMFDLSVDPVVVAGTSNSKNVVVYSPRAFDTGTVIHVTGTASAHKAVYVCFSSNDPAEYIAENDTLAGYEVSDVLKLEGTSIDESVIVPSDSQYIIAYFHTDYWSDRTNFVLFRFADFGKNKARIESLEASVVTTEQNKVFTPDERAIARNNIMAEDSRIFRYTCPVVALSSTPMMFLQYKFERGKHYRITVEFPGGTGITSQLSIRNEQSGADRTRIQTLIPKAARVKGTAIYNCSHDTAEWVLLIVYSAEAEVVPVITIEDAKPVMLEDQSLIGYVRNGKKHVGSNTPLTLLHFSDIHGDVIRLSRILEMGDMCGGLVDDILCTGDMMNDKWDDGYDFWQGKADKVLTAIGNHDVLTSQGMTITGVEAYGRYIGPFVEQWGVVQPDDAESEGKCYYYKDYPNSKIRLIVLDCMHYNGTTGWGSDGDGEQDQWLQEVLDDARTNSLSVICAAHVGPSVSEFIDCTYTDYQYLAQQKQISYNMMTHAQASIDSFVDSGGEFICWLHGHYHCDSIYLHNDNTIGISIDRASGYAENGLSSCARYAFDKSQDAFNLVSFDTSAKLIKLYKVGANMDFRFVRMGALCFNYETKEIVYNS